MPLRKPTYNHSHKTLCFITGMEKINFSGGEPFIHTRGEFVGELARYCKTELGLKSVTIVSNGSLVKEKWFKKYGEQLSIDNLFLVCLSIRQKQRPNIFRECSMINVTSSRCRSALLRVSTAGGNSKSVPLFPCNCYLSLPFPLPFVFIGEFLDIMAVSCDSFNEETNRLIGRHQTGKDHVQCLQQVRQWCTKYRVAFKINTVVNTYNVDEDMTESIQELAPVRWKVS